MGAKANSTRDDILKRMQLRQMEIMKRAKLIKRPIPSKKKNKSSGSESNTSESTNSSYKSGSNSTNSSQESDNRNSTSENSSVESSLKSTLPTQATIIVLIVVPFLQL